MVKRLPAHAGDPGLIPGLGRFPRRRKPTPIFLLRNSHGQRSLAGYSPWVGKRVRYDLAVKLQQFINSVIIQSLKKCSFILKGRLGSGG